MPYQEIYLDSLRCEPDLAIVAYMKTRMGKIATGEIDGMVLRTAPDDLECFEVAFSGNDQQRIQVTRNAAEQSIECIGNNTGAVYSLGKRMNRPSEIHHGGQSKRVLIHFERVTQVDTGEAVGHFMGIESHGFTIPNLESFLTYYPTITLDVAEMELEDEASKLLHEELARLADRRSGQFSIRHFGSRSAYDHYAAQIRTYSSLTGRPDVSNQLAEETISLLCELLRTYSGKELVIPFSHDVRLMNGEASGVVSVQMNTVQARDGTPRNCMILTREDWSEEAIERPLTPEEREAEGWQTWKDEPVTPPEPQRSDSYEQWLEQQPIQPRDDDGWA